DAGFSCQRFCEWSNRLTVIDDARQLLPSELAILFPGQRAEHFPAPLAGAKIHDAGGRCRRHAAHAEVAGEQPRRQPALLHDPRGASPIFFFELPLVLDKMAEAIANRPRTADQLTHFFLPAEAIQPLGVKTAQTLIVPANGAAN